MTSQTLRSYRAIPWQRVRGLAFDMDGTLYRADAEVFYRGYVRSLAARLRNGQPLTLLAEYERWLRGDSPFLSEYLYDFRRRWLVRWDDAQPSEGYDPRSGQAVPPEQLAHAYRDGAPPNRLLRMGDGWTQLGCAAHCYGASMKDVIDGYRAFQDDIIADPGACGIAADSLLSRTLRLLSQRGYYLALMTMSQGEVVTAILRALGVGGVFNVLSEGVRKPDGTPAALRSLAEMTGLAVGEWLVVGDNPVNDLAPAKRLGLPTILVHHPSGGEAANTDLYCPALADCLTVLEANLPPLEQHPRILGRLAPEDEPEAEHAEPGAEHDAAADPLV
ncbi:MAG: HAD family hydrolase [Chloroflexi bacterium]|nr:HAD family hydrolase [Chloroflexota bacterium]